MPSAPLNPPDKVINMEIEDYERATRERGRRNPGFIKPSVLKEPKKVKIMDERVAQMKRDLETPTAFTCSFCDRTFEKLRGKEVHECQCKQNPNALKWARTGTIKKRRGQPPDNRQQPRKRGAQPCNHNRKKKTETVKSESMQAIPETIHPDSETVSNSIETTVLHTEIPHTVGQPAPVKSFATNRLYDYLLAGILLAILLCGIIYAMLGVKLLVGL